MINERTFTLWSDSKFLKLLIQDILYKNYGDFFLWPEKIHSEKYWLHFREEGPASKFAYLPVDSLSQLEKLQEIGIYTIVVTAKLHRAQDLPHSDVLVSGANSYSSCTRAAEFISNQLSCNLQQSSRFIILPNLKSSRRKRMTPS